MYTKEYYLKNILPKLDKNKYVMTGISSMCYNGMSLDNIYMPELLTTNPTAKEGMIVAGIVEYCYTEELDTENYVTPLDGIENILIPSFERSIVENIKLDLKYIDEGYFLEKLERYLTGNFYNLKLLYEVADHFKVPRSKIDYWIEECRDYN